MEKNVGILIGGIAIAGVVAFLSLNPAGSNQGSNPAPSISTSPASTSASPTTTAPSVTAVDQSTSRVATTPKKIKAKTSIGSAGGGDDEERGERGEGDDD